MDKKLTFDIEADEIEIFLEDVNERLQMMETGILRLEQSADAETLNSVFRAAHTLKALAGTVGHHRMADLTHALETIFDAMRHAELTISSEIVDQLFGVIDILKLLRDEIISGEPSGANTDAALEQLRGLAENGQVTAENQKKNTIASRQLNAKQLAEIKRYRDQTQKILEIEIIVSADAFAPAARLLQAAMALAEVGQIVAQSPMTPELSKDHHAGKLWVVLATKNDSQAVEEVLSDVSELGEWHISPYQESKNALAPTTTDVELSMDKTVRISVDRLDTLMNLVGELVTNRTRLLQLEKTLREEYGNQGTVGALNEMAADVSRVIDQLQTEVMRARMLPISYLFDKFPRLVRDVARVADKKVNLFISGEATELDRSIIEAIGDPLIHLLRNAIDHGIETPEDRVARGKQPEGNIWLSAAPLEGQIAITVRDDGRGIDPERVRRVAVERDLLSEEEMEHLNEDETINLLFRPDMSTAEQVTEVSGRGVGLDIVRTNIERLSGSVTVENNPGSGTSFHITLPLTLAIVQTMLVCVRDTHYAIPLAGIVDSLYLTENTVNTVKGRPTIQWRDMVLPLLDLRDFFMPAERYGVPPKQEKPAVVTVMWGKLRAGLVVDKIIGQQEVVVKSLSPIIGRVPGLSGGAILGDGRVALIVDIPSLVDTALQARRQGEQT